MGNLVTVDWSRRHEPPPWLGPLLREAHLARGLSLRGAGLRNNRTLIGDSELPGAEITPLAVRLFLKPRHPRLRAARDRGRGVRAVA
jgi:hypothetical protein